MDEKKKMELTRLQGGMAIASFSAGVGIALGCLFFIEPLGEITNSAIAIVSQLLVLCGTILGVKASYDVKINKMAAEIRNVERRTGGATLTLLLLAIVTAALYLFLHFKNPFKL